MSSVSIGIAQPIFSDRFDCTVAKVQYYLNFMNENLWRFIDAAGELMSKSAGMPPMTGRVLAWLLVCDPPEQTAAQIGEALDASKGSISGATGVLVRARLVDRLHIRGERADRFRIRPDAWDEQIRDQTVTAARALFAIGLEALADEPASRRARLEEVDSFYEWYESRMQGLWEEWQEYKRTKLKGKRNA
jgi:DNA-binding MarR family transcriptional regulator